MGWMCSCVCMCERSEAHAVHIIRIFLEEAGGGMKEEREGERDGGRGQRGGRGERKSEEERGKEVRRNGKGGN